MLLNPVGSTPARQAQALLLAPLGRTGRHLHTPAAWAVGQSCVLSHRIRSLMASHAHERKAIFCVTKNQFFSFSPLFVCLFVRKTRCQNPNKTRNEVVLELPHSSRQTDHTPDWEYAADCTVLSFSATHTHTSEEGVQQPAVSRGAGRRRAGSGRNTRVWNSWFLPSQVASCLAPLAGLGTWRTRGQRGTWPGIAGHRRPESPAQRK